MIFALIYLALGILTLTIYVLHDRQNEVCVFEVLVFTLLWWFAIFVFAAEWWESVKWDKILSYPVFNRTKKKS